MPFLIALLISFSLFSTLTKQVAILSFAIAYTLVSPLAIAVTNPVASIDAIEESLEKNVTSFSPPIVVASRRKVSFGAKEI